jgi:ketosteroid isomerase-like protein
VGVTRTILAGCALAGTVLVLAGCGGSSKSSAAEQLVQKEAAIYQIDQIERSWHQATSTQNVNLMMSLFAPGAVFNIGGETFTGKAQIRKFWETAGPFEPGHHWQSDTPTYKIKTTVNGDKGTLYFECDYLDPKTQKVAAVVAVDHNVQKINGRWLIVDSSGAPGSIKP